MMLAGVPQMLFLSALAAVLLVAFRFGGRDEKSAAFAMMAAAVLTPLVLRHGYAGPEYGIVLVDALLFVALLGIAMGSRAFWPVWAAGFQLVALAVHLAAAAMPSILPAVYAEALGIWSYPVLGALLFGTFVEVRRRRLG